MNNKLIIGIISLIILALVFFFDEGLSLGLGLLAVLSLATYFTFNKLGLKDKKIYLLFLIVLIIRLVTTLFMHYADFQPFSGHGGDYEMYQKSATEASQCFRQGIFSVKNIVLKFPDFYTGHCYPLVVGSLYAVTMPKEIIGLLLNVWLAAISIIFVYLIILEIRGSERGAFIVGLIATVYPSYVFNSGLLLKDTVETCFIILALLFLIKTIKRLTWYNFLILYLAIACVTNLRFYIGYALIITFVLCWFLFTKIDFRKRAIYGIIFIIILGFIPQAVAGQGYYGINSIKLFLNFRMINFYRQQAYNPVYNINPSSAGSSDPSSPGFSSIVGLGSSFVTGGGIVGYIKSFIYVLLGPFPWQIKNFRQSLALVETIPWYFLLFFVGDGLFIVFKKRIKEAMPLIIFSIIAMVVIAIFDSNYGLIVRIRIPAFLSLLCIASLGFTENNIVYKYLNKIYVKMFSYGRSWLYREPISR